MENKINPLLIPNVSRIGGAERGVRDLDRFGNQIEGEEFQRTLGREVEISGNDDIQFSAHAVKRLKERNISMDNDEFLKIRNALSKLKDKGGNNSLVITNNAAYIVDVDKSTVVTAMEKDKLFENVFTKIDSTVFVN